ncbi:MAG: hypothetical protein JWO69_1685 [Thermoleophilia bacterium]|nr:hypothetical protein [Thermoleophilia bacterium]
MSYDLVMATQRLHELAALVGANTVQLRADPHARHGIQELDASAAPHEHAAYELARILDDHHATPQRSQHWLDRFSL